jgi:hypothetical protein
MPVTNASSSGHEFAALLQESTVVTAHPETLVTADMIESKGKLGEPSVSPPIALSDIRKWAIAVYWPDAPPRIYWDEEYARSTTHGGIVAPLDFNPFAWPIVKGPTSQARTTAEGAGQGARGMNGGQTEEYDAPMRPGDVITSTSALVEWYERTTRLGLTLFTITETRWTNQNGETVKVKRSTGIRY